MKLKAKTLMMLFLGAAFLFFNTAMISPTMAPPKKLEGKIVKRDFKNKLGMVDKKTYDLFFETSDTAYFIKMSESSISQSDVFRLINKPISIKGKIKEGRWDSDDPKIESREGKYLVIQKVLD